MRFAPLVAALAAAATLALPTAASAKPTAAPVILPPAGAALGVVPTPRAGRTFEQETLFLESEIGRSFKFTRFFHAWGQNIVTTAETRSIAAGRTPIINLAANVGTTSCSWRAIANGSQDGYIATQAAAVKNLGVPVVLFFHHEPEDDTGWCGSAKDYRDAWVRLRARFDAAGVTNVVYGLDMMAWTFNPKSGRNPDAYYPGGSVVDWVVANTFNWYPGQAGSRWTEMSTMLDPFVTWMAAHHPNKTLGVGASGVQEDPAVATRKGDWFRNVLTYFKAHPVLRVWVYYNSDKIYPWWLDTSAASIAGFRAATLDPWFNPVSG